MVTMIGFSAADGITLGIACVGALTGVIALVLNVHQFLIAGPRLRVETEPARLGPNSRIIGGKWDSHLDEDMRAAHPQFAVAVHAINSGRMPTIIESWGIDIGDGMTFRALHHPHNRQLPTKIEAGERITFFADLSDVDAGNRASAEVLGSKRGEVRGVITLGDGTSVQDKDTLLLPPRDRWADINNGPR